MIHSIVKLLLIVMLYANVSYALGEKTSEGKILDPNTPIDYPTVVITTSLGDIEVELFNDKAPETVKNFLAHVDNGFYNGTLFHRVIPGFMVQGGGFESNMTLKPTATSVINESHNGLKNERGTLSMARTRDPDSASTQFFINIVDNNFLNGSTQKPGYTVFGKVTNGLDVADKIASVPTTFIGHYRNVPKKEITIQSIKRL